MQGSNMIHSPNTYSKNREYVVDLRQSSDSKRFIDRLRH